jgi:hypothetical protein
MKKFYVLIAMLLVASFTFGQAKKVMDVTKFKKVSSAYDMSQAYKTVIDTAGMSDNFSPQFGAPTFTFQRIAMTDGGAVIGWWFGNSGDISPDSLEADMWVQAWVNTSAVKVTGVLFLPLLKYNYSGGAAASKLSVGIYKMFPYASGQHGCVTGTGTYGPSPWAGAVARGSMNIADVDTSGVYNYIPLTGSGVISSGDFAVVADFKGIRVSGDTLAGFADADGNGLGLHYSQFCVDTLNYYYVSTNHTQIGLDVNWSIFAIIDDGVGIEDNSSFQGLKMTLRQAPTTTFVDYAVDFNSNVTLYVYDINGKEVAKINEGTKTAGNVNTIALNTSNFAKGMYFCSLECAGGRLTKKLVIQ